MPRSARAAAEVVSFMLDAGFSSVRSCRRKIERWAVLSQMAIPVVGPPNREEATIADISLLSDADADAGQANSSSNTVAIRRRVKATSIRGAPAGSSARRGPSGVTY